MFETTNARRAFLDSLPEESRKKVLIKVAIIGFLGFILSIVSLIATLISIKYDPNTPDNWTFLMMIIAQDFPIFLLTLLLFYRKKLKDIFLQLWPRVSNKSFLLILEVLLLDLFLGIVLNLITFLFSNSPETAAWLESYVNSGHDNLSFSYLYVLFQSFIIFLFIAFFEEFVFRFTLFRFLRKRGLILALLVSSILFGIIHGSNGTFTAIIGGIIIALYYEYTNNFLGTVIIHTFYNLLIVYYSYFLTYYILQLKLF